VLRRFDCHWQFFWDFFFFEKDLLLCYVVEWILDKKGSLSLHVFEIRKVENENEEVTVFSFPPAYTSQKSNPGHLIRVVTTSSSVYFSS